MRRWLAGSMMTAALGALAADVGGAAIVIAADDVEAGARPESPEPAPSDW